MAAQGRVRLYRELLTPALHRRFIASTGWALLLCWAEGFLMTSKTSSKVSCRADDGEELMSYSLLVLVPPRTCHNPYPDSLPL